MNKEYRKPLEAEKGKEMDSPETPEGNVDLGIPWFLLREAYIGHLTYRTVICFKINLF